jgi:hypothetical protein
VFVITKTLGISVKHIVMPFEVESPHIEHEQPTPLTMNKSSDWSNHGSEDIHLTEVKTPPASNLMNISINLDSAKFEKEDSISDSKEDTTNKSAASYDSSLFTYGTNSSDSSSSSSTLSSTDDQNANATIILR